MRLGASKTRIWRNVISSKIKNRKQNIAVAWPCAERSQGVGPGQAIKRDQKKKEGGLCGELDSIDVAGNLKEENTA